MILSDPSGNPNTTTFTSLGCPIFSAGEPLYVETLFIASHTAVLDWLQEVADTSSKAKPYKNPAFTIVYTDGPEEKNDWSDWEEERNSAAGVTNSANGDSGDGGLLIVPGDSVVAEEASQEKTGGDEQEEMSALGKFNDSLSALKESLVATMKDAKSKA